ncbi:MAG: helix-turn-helix domain-containing protein [Christensenellales bacterium]|jgi:DNA-binding XRE family transcriptional regulator/desulfoferrodoxin (superoxide reductase-like protein)
MDYTKSGRLIKNLRKEKGFTQKQLADAIQVSDKTISKWERGQGCPDVSLLRALSETLGVDIEKILSGNLEVQRANSGNMSRIRFYVCPTCGNVITSAGKSDVSCCGRKLAPLVAKPRDNEHYLNIEKIENDYYITFPHEMVKEHYIKFVAYVSIDRMLFVRLYPEQDGELRMPIMAKGAFYFCCNKHGLWVN